MKIFNQVLKSIYLPLLILSASASNVLAYDQRVAEISWSPSEILFTPNVSGTLSLTISSNTGIYKQSDFEANVMPSFQVYDENGLLPDGNYKYELEALNKSDMESHETITQENINGFPKQRLVQNGYFQIMNGQIEPFTPPADKTDR